MGLEFKSEKLGEFKYECKGKGCLPTAMTPLELALPQDSESHFSVMFKNPFSETVNLSLFLEQPEDSEVFSFKYSTKLNHQLEPFNKLDIYLKFAPPQFGKYHCSVSVQIGNSLKWVFPVVVETECDMTALVKPYRIRTKSDQAIQQRLSFCLYGVHKLHSDVKSVMRARSAMTQDLDPDTFMDGMQISNVPKHQQLPDFKDLSQFNIKSPENTDKPQMTDSFFNNISKKSIFGSDGPPKRHSLLSFLKDKKSPSISKSPEPFDLKVKPYDEHILSEISGSDSEIQSENSLIKKENIFFHLKLDDKIFEDLVSQRWLSIEKAESKLQKSKSTFESHNTVYNNQSKKINQKQPNNKLKSMGTYHKLGGGDGMNPKSMMQKQKTKHQINSSQPSNQLSHFQHIDFLFDLHPKKPFVCGGTFTVSLAKGGRWKYGVLFEVTEPKYYDTLNITTCLNIKKGVQFRVFNCGRFKSFRAFFKEDSDAGFEVTPTSGDLLTHSGNGTLFTVTFLPREYGKTRKARLVIETGDRYYLFMVRGKFQKYSPPNK